MANTRLIKRRIKTTKNIHQITKAMEMVAASKMRRAQEQATASKPYSGKLQETLRRIAQTGSSLWQIHPLLRKNTVGKHVVLLVSSDKGLTGGLATNLFRGTEDFKFSHPEINGGFEFIVVGRKAREYALKTGATITAEFSNLPERLHFTDSLPISRLILDGYKTKKFRKVTIIYMDFISTLIQKVSVNQLLPIEIAPEILAKPEEVIERDVAAHYDYVFEPSPKEILQWLLPYYIEIEIYQTLLEAKASEHSARMVAMKNASDNAKEIMGDLTLEYNKSRQASITSELLDIITATSTT